MKCEITKHEWVRLPEGSSHYVKYKCMHCPVIRTRGVEKVKNLPKCITRKIENK